MPLYILVTTHLDLENKEVLLRNTYLLVSCLQWEIFHIKYNVCPDSVRWFTWSSDFNRFSSKCEDQLIVVILTDWHHRDAEKADLKIKAWDGVSQEKEIKASAEITLLKETFQSKECFPEVVQAVFHSSSHWRKPGSETLHQLELWVNKWVFSMDCYQPYNSHCRRCFTRTHACSGTKGVMQGLIQKTWDGWKYSFNLCEFRCLPHLFISHFSASSCYAFVSFTILFY